MLLRRFFLLGLLGAIVVAGIACSSSPTEAAATPDASSPAPPEVDAGMADAAPPRSAACVAQDAKLQAALDAARMTPNAVVAVKTPACGTTTYTSGSASTATASSLYRIGSVTKTYVSTVILGLVDDGKVALSDPLSRWFPGFPGAAGVTVRMLMNHTSGIFDYTEDASFMAKRDLPTTPDAIVAVAASHPVYFAPGASWHYSNTNYILLGRIAELASGKKIDALLHERAFARAKLTSTFLDGAEPLGGKLAHGFTGTDDVTTYDDPSVAWTAGAMVATGADVAEWITRLYGGSVLSAAGRQALTDAPASTGDGSSYGLGVALIPPLSLGVVLGAKTGAAIGHDGSIDGFTSFAFYFPKVDTAVVALTNESSGDPNGLFLATLKVLFP